MRRLAASSRCSGVTICVETNRLTATAARVAAPALSSNAWSMADRNACAVVSAIPGIMPRIDDPFDPIIVVMRRSNSVGAILTVATNRVTTPTAITSRCARKILPRRPPVMRCSLFTAPSSEAIAGAAHRLDIVRRGRVIAELLAQVRDMHVHYVVVAEVVFSPDALQELIAGEDAARMGRKRGQQGVFEYRKRDDGSVQRDLVARVVDHEIAKALRRRDVGHGGWVDLAWPAQNRADTCDQFARREGLGEVIVRAHLQADDSIDLLGLGGEHDHIG